MADLLSWSNQEEQHFYAIFKEVLDCIKEKKMISDIAIQTGIECINKNFNFDSGGRFFKIDLTSYDNICGYLFRFGSHGAGLTRFRVLEAVGNCAELDSGLRKPEPKYLQELRVVSLGGGPGNDAVGFCSALHELYRFQNRKLTITVVDKFQEWEECVDQVARLVREKHFGNVSEMFRLNDVTLSFNGTWLPGDPVSDKECYDALETADIILMTKVLSGMLLSDIPPLIQELQLAMKEDALFLLINTTLQRNEAGKLLYNGDDNIFSQFELLYLSEEGNAYYQESETHSRFRYYEADHSAARMAVLRKVPH